ncbi:MAG: TonB-dependent receptor [Ignavibacteriae bacterium]|nr:MAG: TonB-dependent receptor [Ignavibacteriota bacterium]
MFSFRGFHVHFYVVCFIFLFSASLLAQSGSISGKIVNADDQTPLSSVNISLLDKAMDASTNSEGVYELANVPAGVYTLQASSVGYKLIRLQVTVADSKVNLDIQLKPEPIGMNEVVISGYRETYSTGDNYSALRMNAPMMTLPLSTAQVTNKLLTDQNIINMNEALRNVSGVATEFGGPHPLVVNIRGFNASVFKDGFKIGGGGTSGGGDDLPVSSISVDRIEVLKGPSTILYGRGEPGGIINFISKQPQMESGYTVEAMTGSFQQYRLGGSATGPLLSESVLYRVDGSYEKSNSYRDEVKSNTYFVKPSFALNVSEETKVYLTGEISRSEFTPDRGVLMLPSVSADGIFSASFAPISSRSYFFGLPTDNTDQNQQRVVAEVEHIITPDWTVRLAANYEYVTQWSLYEVDYFYTYKGTMPAGIPAGTFPPNWSIRLHSDLNSNRTDYGTRFESSLRLSHQLFGTRMAHGILVAADMLQIKTDLLMDYNPNQLLDVSTGTRMNVSLPMFVHEENFSKSKDYGISFQDLITIDERWHLLLGGRYENNSIDVTQLAAYTTTPKSTKNESSGFVPRLGVLYQFYDNMSLYASYMGSYQTPGADYGLWDIPADLKPERAYQAETGVKLELLNKRALLSASVFMIDKYDVIASENNPAGVSPYKLYYNIGKEDAQGFDIDVVGEVTSNLRVSAAFNAQKMKFTNPKKIIVDGKQRYGTPTYSGNVWAVYEFNNGLFNGLGIGGGASTRSEVFVNDANEAKVPAYTTFDAVTYYEFAKLRFQLNFYNITNELSYNVGNGGGGNPTAFLLLMPSAPFRTTLSVRYQI